MPLQPRAAYGRFCITASHRCSWQYKQTTLKGGEVVLFFEGVSDAGGVCALWLGCCFWPWHSFQTSSRTTLVNSRSFYYRLAPLIRNQFMAALLRNWMLIGQNKKHQVHMCLPIITCDTLVIQYETAPNHLNSWLTTNIIPWWKQLI